MARFSRCCSTAAAPLVKLSRLPHGLVQLTLNRPSKLNALSLPMFRGIQAAAKQLLDDKTVRAIVIHGEGRCFCAGLDIRSMASSPLSWNQNMRELLTRPDGEISNLAQDVAYLWRRIPVPVIAAVHGVCLGGGFQIALGADMRIAASKTKLSIMEAKWGLIPDMSATVTLRELVPKDVAMELTMTGRVFDSEEALRLGLVTQVVADPLTRALDIANAIAARSPDSTAAAKRLLNATYSEANDDARALKLETALQRKLLLGWNMLACTAKGLGVPPAIQPGFCNRSSEWDVEADEAAEAELREMLGDLDES
ncbi:MAG: hypothetical protein SGPRY_000410 [Prymnesium sp.]